MLALALLLVGPQLVTPFTAQVSDLELFWQHTDETNTQEYNGLLKLRTREYESGDGKTGLLYVIALSSLVPLGDLPLDLEQLIIDRVETEAELQRLELSNGRRGGTLAIAQGHQAKLLEWDATVTGTGGFFSLGGNLQVIAAYWEVEQGLVICVAFGIDNIDIYPQAKNMIESVKT